MTKAKRTWQPLFCQREVDQGAEEQLALAGLEGFRKSISLADPILVEHVSLQPSNWSHLVN